MDDFLTYFLAGMLGEDLLRRLATKPYGFIILWFSSFLFVNLLFMLILIVFGIVTMLQVGIPEEETLIEVFLSFVKDFSYFFFVIAQPWASVASIIGGLMLTLGYRSHYKRNIADKKKT